VIVDCAIYDKGYRREGTHTLSEAADAVDHPGAFVWIGMYEPTESEFEEVGREFGLHELAIEDAIKAHQRPKLEIYGTSLFVVLKTARYIDESESVELGEIQVFVGEHFAVVVRHGEGSALAETRKRIEGREDLLALGPATVLYAVVDRVVDNYLPVVHGLEHDITQVEYQVFSNNDSHNPVERIYKLKREVLEMYGATAPLLEPLEQLASKELPCVPDETHDYFRDVHDHLVRVKDEIERFRELLTSVLEANLTRVSVRQNEDMRKISAWVAIAAVPTAVAGIYGMNFDHMPELGWTFGYPLALVIMGTACLLLYRAFRRSGWL
jgi:magnesium transporter